jgi:hypothetical protein
VCFCHFGNDRKTETGTLPGDTATAPEAFKYALPICFWHAGSRAAAVQFVSPTEMQLFEADVILTCRCDAVCFRDFDLLCVPDRKEIVRVKRRTHRIPLRQPREFL